MDNKRFCRSLDQVANKFGVPYSTVIEWRDQMGCEFLEKSPYDINGISKWIDFVNDEKINPATELELQKIKAEIQSIESKNDLLGKDKAFLITALSLGLIASEQVKEWVIEWLDPPTLKQLRVKHGIRMIALANASGLSRQTILLAEKRETITESSMTKIVRGINDLTGASYTVFSIKW